MGLVVSSNLLWQSAKNHLTLQCLETTKKLTPAGLDCLKLCFLKTLIQNVLSACSCHGGVDNILKSFKSFYGAKTLCLLSLTCGDQVREHSTFKELALPLLDPGWGCGQICWMWIGAMAPIRAHTNLKLVEEHSSGHPWPHLAKPCSKQQHNLRSPCIRDS